MIRLFTLPLLVVSLICCISCGAIEVNTAQQLVDIFATATEPVNENIEVTSDLNFLRTNISLPLGAYPNGTCVPYCGTL